MTSASPSPSPHGLKVIALISGGKDSLYSLLHCLANGHDVVALANLHPPAPLPSPSPAQAGAAEPQLPEDMDSYMYQTVGHNVLPLYADALGIPLYRQEIRGGARNTDISYSVSARRGGTRAQGASPAASGAQDEEWDDDEEQDETESLTRLLRTVTAPGNRPDANAVAAGAILSTYQRTRIEDVAARLGLVPLAYLWQYDVLPAPAPPPSATPVAKASETATTPRAPQCGDRRRKRARTLRAPPAQLLHDMAAAGLEARIVKVASGGLDERFLWRDVADPATAAMLVRAAARFGGAGRGAVLGEGGEFETLVLDGPAGVWRGRIEVGAGAEVQSERAWEVVAGGGGGGSAAVTVRSAKVVVKDAAGAAQGEDLRKKALARVRIPQLLDPEFEDVLSKLADVDAVGLSVSHSAQPPLRTGSDDRKSVCAPLEYLPPPSVHRVARTIYISNLSASPHSSVREQTAAVLATLRHELSTHSLTPQHLTHTTILLRRMADFAQVNELYGQLFTAPNPPARATVAVGDALPSGVDVVLHAVADDCNVVKVRRGLHVQSRSYWAPANIGPYSQAICVPLSARDDSETGTTDDNNSERDDSRDDAGQQVVYVAGQIPLVPASMELADKADFARSVVLACQHLWRVGRAMDVGWWVSGVAFVTADNEREAAERAKLAGSIWREMHVQETDEDAELDSEDEDFDIAEQSLRRGWDSIGASGGALEIAPALPDWSMVITGVRGQGERWPPGFVVQAAELPREAQVEWSSFGLGMQARIHIYEDNLRDGEEQAAVLHFCRPAKSRQGFACGAARNTEQLEDMMRYLQGANQEFFCELYTSESVPQFLRERKNIAVVPSLRVWSFEGEQLLAGVRCRFRTR